MLRYACLTVVLGVAPAYALKPSMHADILKTACVSAGLSKDFCQRAATDDYTTDALEWDDLRAHAQIDDGDTACTAADRTAARLYDLGRTLRGELASVARYATEDNVANAASALGRALHTIQDSCAHDGMPNPQHAWFSVSDFCDGTKLSPDIQSNAITCAKSETEQVMRAVAAAARPVNTKLADMACPQPQSSEGGSQQNACLTRFLPSPIDACHFMATAKQWDGIDRTWNHAMVAPALREAFVAGLEGRAIPGSVCGGNEGALSRPVSQPVLDVSVGAPTCAATKALCLGKVDAGNPFDDDVIDEPEAGGCTTSRGHGVLLLLGFAAWLACRQRCAK